MTQIPLQKPANYFELMGGHATFSRLVDVFYSEVAADEYLIAMYPEGQALDGAKDRLQTFLEQYFGGPTTYSQERGHPRLRLRHNVFRITPKGREHWLRHMRTALDDVALPPIYDDMAWDYFQRAAAAMINTLEEG